MSKIFDKYEKTSKGAGSVFRDSYKTYSGCDIVPVVYGRDSNGKNTIFVIGDIATLTYSIHQDKGAVRTLGRTAPRAFVRGPETIAGTMIFNIFNKQALWELAKNNRDKVTHRVSHSTSLPSFDILMYFSSEYGEESSLGIFGIQIMDEGQSHSVEDTYVENTMSYVALKVEPLEPKASNKDFYNASSKFISAVRNNATDGYFGNLGNPFDYSYLDQS